MIAFPNAKINLGLHVCHKRPDGYHHIETIFYPIPLCDILEVVHAPQGSAPWQWHNSGMAVDAPAGQNICIKALQLVQHHYAIGPVQVQLHKIIPFGAGLGGGSSDGAAMIDLLDKLFELQMPLSLRTELATRLGADCPFFIHNRPAFATGIGNELTPISLNLSGFHLVLVKPPIHVSTPEAYRGVTPAPPRHSLTQIAARPVSEWKQLLINDFEQSVFARHPQIGHIKDELYRLGAVYAAMSGSGSTVFGLFETKAQVSFPHCFVWQGAL